MIRNATKMKIKVCKGRWFRLVLPGLSFRFIKRICRLGLKFSGRQINRPAEDIDREELMENLELLLDQLSAFEPFVLVEVTEETEKIHIKIETV